MPATATRKTIPSSASEAKEAEKYWKAFFGRGHWERVPDALNARLTLVFSGLEIKVLYTLLKETAGKMPRRIYAPFPQAEMASELGVSVSGIAKALDILEASGAIEGLPAKKERTKSGQPVRYRLLVDRWSVISERVIPERWAQEPLQYNLKFPLVVIPGSKARPIQEVCPDCANHIRNHSCELGKALSISEQNHNLTDVPSALECGGPHQHGNPSTDASVPPARKVENIQRNTKSSVQHIQQVAEVPSALECGGSTIPSANGPITLDLFGEFLVKRLGARIAAPLDAKFAQEQFQRLVESQTPFDAFVRRFDTRGRNLLSFKGISWIVDDAIEAHRQVRQHASQDAAAPANPSRQPDNEIRAQIVIWALEFSKLPALSFVVESLEKLEPPYDVPVIENQLHDIEIAASRALANEPIPRDLRDRIEDCIRPWREKMPPLKLDLLRAQYQVQFLFEHFKLPRLTLDHVLYRSAGATA